MASNDAALPLWERANLEQQILVRGSEFERLLTQNRVKLIRNLCLSSLWPYLRQYEALTEDEEETITHNAPGHQVAGRLLDQIARGPLWKFHSLMKACIETNQEHIVVDILKLNPKPYSDEPPQEQSPDVLHEAIIEHCESSKRTLMRRKVFDFQDDPSADIIDTSKCYTRIRAKYKGGQDLVIEIDEDDLLGPFQDEDSPRSLRLTGAPGVGKTTLMRRIAYLHSLKVLQHKADGMKGLPILNTMVYIPARSIRTTIKDAITEHLFCRRKGVLQTHIDEGKGVVIFIDAIDEIKNAKIMHDLKMYVKERQLLGGPIVFISTRTDSCPIDVEFFDRFLILEGFSIDQGIGYVCKYFSGRTVSPSKEHPVLDYVKLHKQKIEAVLRNPLWLHIFCGLTSKGILKLDERDFENFKLLQLFEPLEMFLTTRESEPVIPEQSKAFYRLCMYGMLTGLQEFPESLMSEFNIAENYYVFLEKNQRRNTYAVLEAYYSFNHEMVYEYFASRFVCKLPRKEQVLFVFLICCKARLENVQKIVFQMLIEEGSSSNQELVRLMIQAILLLSPDVQWPDDLQSIQSVQHLMHLQIWLLSIEPGKDMSLGRSVQENYIVKAEDMRGRINKLFSTTLLQRAVFFPTLWRNGTLRHIIECVEMCEPTLRTELIQSTIHCMLPCKYVGKLGESFVHHQVGKMRWAVVRKEESTIQLDSWCIGDACQILSSTQTGTNADVNRVGIYTDQYRDLWGHPPSSSWSADKWATLLSEVARLWPGSEIYLWMHPSVSLEGLVDSFEESKLSLRRYTWKRLVIYSGSLSFTKVFSFSQKPGVAMPVQFRYLRIVIHNRKDYPEMRTQRNELRLMSKKNLSVVNVSSPIFLTPLEKKFVWSDGFEWGSGTSSGTSISSAAATPRI